MNILYWIYSNATNPAWNPVSVAGQTFATSWIPIPAWILGKRAKDCPLRQEDWQWTYRANHHCRRALTPRGSPTVSL